MVRLTDEQKSAIDKWNKANRGKKPFNKHWNALLVDTLNRDVFGPYGAPLLAPPTKQQLLDAQRARARKEGGTANISEVSSMSGGKHTPAKGASSSKGDFTVSLDMSGIMEGMESTLRASMRAMVSRSNATPHKYNHHASLHSPVLLLQTATMNDAVKEAVLEAVDDAMGSMVRMGWDKCLAHLCQ
jgi:hypothetical protein